MYIIVRMKEILFKVSINNKVINLFGRFIGSRFWVDSSSIDNHLELTPEEKER